MHIIRKGISVLIGSSLVAVGVNLFLIPQSLMDGGMIGIGLLAKYYLHWPPGFTLLLFSLPIYALVFFCDRQLFYNSLHGMVLSAFLIDVCSPLRSLGSLSIAEASVLGGALIGAGIGLMFAYDTNTGGTDLLAQFAAKRMGWPPALLIFLIDGVIVASSLKVIGPYRTMYSLVTIGTVAITTHVFSQIRCERPVWIVIGPLFRFRSRR